MPCVLSCPCRRYELFEEAFEIYKKFGLKQQAIRVVLEHMEDLDRAHEFATKVGPFAVKQRCKNSIFLLVFEPLWRVGPFLLSFRGFG